MKYKKGDKLENEIGRVTVQGVIGEIYILKSDDDRGFLESDESLEKYKYTLIPPEIPKEGVPVKINKINNYWEVRISSGKLDKYGSLLCYLDGRFEGRTTGWKKWEVIKCK